MMNEKNTDKSGTVTEATPEPAKSDRSLAERDRDYVRTLRTTKNPRAAVRAYCAGNVWATENAKGVGNW
jgi:hypothetical protein